MEEEMWKTIPDFNRYEASNRGYIRNKQTMHMMSPNVHKSGYLRTCLTNDVGKLKNISVHRMITSAFFDNPQNYPTVNHIDYDRTNNHITNLEWASVAQQNQHSRSAPPVKSKLVGARSVQRIDLQTGETTQTYDTLTNAGEWVVAQGLSKSNHPSSSISLVCRNKQKSTFGFGWSYKSDEIIVDEDWELLPPSLVNGKHGFFISNNGRVRNKTGRISKPYDQCGYLMVSISTRNYYLHRLVAEVFLENPNHLPYVINLDNNKDNNCVSNLKWSSRSDAISNARKQSPNIRSNP